MRLDPENETLFALAVGCAPLSLLALGVFVYVVEWGEGEFDVFVMWIFLSMLLSCVFVVVGAALSIVGLIIGVEKRPFTIALACNVVVAAILLAIMFVMSGPRAGS